MDSSEKEFLELVGEGKALGTASRIVFGKDWVYKERKDLQQQAQKIVEDRKALLAEERLYKIKALMVTGMHLSGAIKAVCSVSYYYGIPHEVRVKILGFAEAPRKERDPDEPVPIFAECRAGMLQEINECCKARGITKRAFITSLIRKELNRFRDEQAKAA